MRNYQSAALGVLASLWMTSAAQADLLTFTTALGPEQPGATGSGSAVVIFDTEAQTLRVTANFSGLSGVTTVAHIHGPTAVPGTGTAGVITTLPTFPGFPTGVSAGTYDQLFDLTAASTFNPSFITANGGTVGASEALLNALLAEKAYLNIHTSTFGGGEIRGFLSVPDGGVTIALLSMGLTGVALARRLRKI
jgi:hypothetical protein